MSITFFVGGSHPQIPTLGFSAAMTKALHASIVSNNSRKEVVVIEPQVSSYLGLRLLPAARRIVLFRIELNSLKQKYDCILNRAVAFFLIVDVMVPTAFGLLTMGATRSRLTTQSRLRGKPTQTQSFVSFHRDHHDLKASTHLATADRHATGLVHCCDPTIV